MGTGSSGKSTKGTFTLKTETIGGRTAYYVQDPKTGQPYRWGGDADQKEIHLDDKQGAQWLASELNSGRQVTELDWALMVNETYGDEKPDDIRKRYDKKGRPKKQKQKPKRAARDDDLPF